MYQTKPPGVQKSLSAKNLSPPPHPTPTPNPKRHADRGNKRQNPPPPLRNSHHGAFVRFPDRDRSPGSDAPQDNPPICVRCHEPLILPHEHQRVYLCRVPSKHVDRLCWLLLGAVCGEHDVVFKSRDSELARLFVIGTRGSYIRLYCQPVSITLYV